MNESSSDENTRDVDVDVDDDDDGGVDDHDGDVDENDDDEPPLLVFQREAPGLFFFVGVTPPEQDPTKAYANHSPRFYADEAGLLPGLRALAQVACDFLESRVE